MISVEVKFPSQQQQRILRFLNPRRVRWAEKEAVNISGTRTAKLAHKLIAKEMGITPTNLRKRGRQTKTRRGVHGTVSRGRRATLRHLRTTVDGYGKPFNTTRWNAQAVKEGKRTVGVMHSAWGRQQYAPGAWILETKKGKPVVHRDRGKGYVDGHFGPGVTHVMQYPHIERQLVTRARRVLLTAFRRRLKYAFSAESHLKY